MQASLPQPADFQAGDLGDAGVRQRREQVGGSGRPVTPAVGHRFHLPAGARDGVLDNEPVIVQRAHGQQVPGTLDRGVDEVLAMQRRPSDGQRGGYPGGAM